ncbi:MAG TPA: MoxR family ATPase [Saprospiraceae bacterium]|nr:MoxR family ATPase [Saprospiraceae bacterium]HMQ85430.1 MoxR family ATPase [Saprospiraceae bacterium]
MHLEDHEDGQTPNDETTFLSSSPSPQEVRSNIPPVSYRESSRLDLTRIKLASDLIREELHRVIIGQHELIDLLIAGMFSGGHVLIEGVPGIAKTLTAKLLAQTMDIAFSRIQFTPDLMPSDVLGTTVFNLKTSEFTFNAGPIFSNIVLIDEINRAPAKTQAALFEVMEEFQVTVDGETYPMSFPFLVLATQNPIEQEGTYKLPEAQLDRFIIKINLKYPELSDEKAILRRFRNDFQMANREKLKVVFTAEDLKACRNLIEQLHIKDELLDYIAQVVHSTRNHGDLFLGASPRASLAIMKLAKTIAAMSGRDFVTPDDIQYAAYPVLNHRIILTPEREMEGYTTKEVIRDIIQKIEVPR